MRTTNQPAPYVLVVEDDQDCRDTLQEVLLDSGVEVDAAGSCEVALELMEARQQAPALILLDLSLPGMGPAGFRDALLSRPVWANVPVVILSGAAEAHQEAQRLRTDGALEKPFEFDALLALVERYLQKAQVTGDTRVG